MTNSKAIDMANLELAMSENNQKLKSYVDANNREVKLYQRYVNVELDSCFCRLTESHTPVVGTYVPFQKISGAMDVQDGLITVKSGQRVQANVSLAYSNPSNQNVDNVTYALRDVTNNIDITTICPVRDVVSQYEFPCSATCQWTNESIKDCQIALYVVSVNTADVLDAGLTCLTIQEIGRQIVIDPVEYVNTAQGIEDTPVGHIVSYMGTIAPKHYLVCDGAEYVIADYPYLAQHIQDNFGSVNYFGGDGETTFAVPNLIERFLKGSENPGVHQEPGLPNITANWKSEPSASANGAVYIQSEKGSLQAVSSGGSSDNRLYFDASRSCPIYGKSETVTPENVSVLYCIKYEPTYCTIVKRDTTDEDIALLEQQIETLERQVLGLQEQNESLYQEISTLETILEAINRTDIDSEPIEEGTT